MNESFAGSSGSSRVPRRLCFWRQSSNGSISSRIEPSREQNLEALEDSWRQAQQDEMMRQQTGIIGTKPKHQIAPDKPLTSALTGASARRTHKLDHLMLCSIVSWSHSIGNTQHSKMTKKLCAGVYISKGSIEGGRGLICQMLPFFLRLFASFLYVIG